MTEILTPERPTAAPPDLWGREDQRPAESRRTEVLPPEHLTEARKKLVEDERYQEYLEAKKIYGTRFEAMGRLATTLIGKGWLWNRGEGGKSQTTEKMLQWVGKNIDLPVTRAFEENRFLRTLKFGAKGGLYVAGAAGLLGMAPPAAMVMLSPVIVDATLDFLQFVKERHLVDAWKQRSEMRKELKTVDEGRKNEILSALDQSREDVDRLAGSKRRWGMKRLAAKLATGGAAALFLHLHGITSVAQDLDHLHSKAAAIIGHHGGHVDSSNISAVQHGSMNLLHHSSDLSAQEKSVLEMASMLNDKHTVHQHLFHSEFIYNKGDDLAALGRLHNAGSLQLVDVHGSVGHTMGTNLIGYAEGFFGWAANDVLARKTAGPFVGSVQGMQVGEASGQVSKTGGGVLRPEPELESAETVKLSDANEQRESLSSISTEIEIDGTKYQLLNEDLRPDSTFNWEPTPGYKFADYIITSGPYNNYMIEGTVEGVVTNSQGKKYYKCRLRNYGNEPLFSDDVTYLIPQNEPEEPEREEGLEVPEIPDFLRRPEEREQEGRQERVVISSSGDTTTKEEARELVKDMRTKQSSPKEPLKYEPPKRPQVKGFTSSSEKLKPRVVPERLKIGKETYTVLPKVLRPASIANWIPNHGYPYSTNGGYTIETHTEKIVTHGEKKYFVCRMQNNELGLDGTYLLPIEKEKKK
ncbi:MAG: hypothetical protein NT135_00085 [Candidatus Berkelbacteria bacterium]|nr:hypothetical protein [Candidatus Berkelbacteria bacterium]